MAEQLGTAVLEITVDTRAAEEALNQFRTRVQSALSIGGGDIFKGIEAQAQAAGARAGQSLAAGIKQATAGLKFENLQQALSFSPKNTVRGLEDYITALRRLRDSSDLSGTSVQQLSDRIGAVQSALRRARQTTADATAEQRRLAEALNATTYRRLLDESRQFGANLKAQSEAAAAFRSQLTGIATTALDAAKAVAGITLKTAGGAAGLAIFGLPKGAQSSIDAAIAQVRRLQEQAETAGGKVARLTEGVAVIGAGGLAAKGITDILAGIGNEAQSVSGTLAGVREALASLPGPLKGLGGLDDIFASGASAVGEWASGILQAQANLSGLAAPIEAVTNAIASLGPEAALVGAGLALAFAGLQDTVANSFKPGVEGARAALKGMTADTQALLEALNRASEASREFASTNDLRLARQDALNRQAAAPAGSEDNLAATRDLLAIDKQLTAEKTRQWQETQKITRSEAERLTIAQKLRDAATAPAAKALPSSSMLNAEGRGIQRLNGTGPNDVSLQKGIEDARKFTQELVRTGSAAQRLDPIFGQVNLSLKSLVGLTEQATGATKAEAAAAELNRQRHRAAAEEARRRRQAILDAKKAQDAENAAIKKAEDAERRRLKAAEERAAKARRDKRDGAIGSAVIGGAFPLLFGQGLGASIGGGLGGGIGGAMGGQFGFGLSLVGTAVGASFDAMLQKGRDLAQGLRDPIASFDALVQAAVFSSKATERYIKNLIDAGRTNEAQIEIQKDLLNTFGSTQGLSEYNDAVDTLNRSWSQATTVLASFVAGPLAELIRQLQQPTGNLAVATRYEQLAGSLSPEQYSKAIAARNRATDASRQSRGGLSSFLPPTEGDVKTGRQAFIREAEKQLGVDKQRAEIQARLNSAQLQNKQSLSDSYKLIDASVQGSERKVLLLQREQKLNERNRQLLALPPQDRKGPLAQKIQQDTALAIYEINQRIAELDQKRWAESIAAANRLRSIQEQVLIAQQSLNLTGTGTGVLQAEAQFRDAIRNEQNTQAALRTNPNDRGLVNAAAEATENVRKAAVETRNALIEGFRSAKESAIATRDALLSAITQYAKLRSDPTQGINQFLSGDAQFRRLENANRDLRPLFDQAVKQLYATAAKEGLGAGAVQAPRLTGNAYVDNETMTKLIEAVQVDTKGRDSVRIATDNAVKANNDLVIATNALVNNNITLNDTLVKAIPAISGLAAKDWNVYVNVPGASVSGAVLGGVS